MESCCDQHAWPVELWDEMTASRACWKNCDHRISSQWSCCDHRILMERCHYLPGPWRMVVNEDCGRDLFERNNTCRRTSFPAAHGRVLPEALNRSFMRWRQFQSLNQCAHILSWNHWAPATYSNCKPAGKYVMIAALLDHLRLEITSLRHCNFDNTWEFDCSQSTRSMHFFHWVLYMSKTIHLHDGGKIIIITKSILLT